MNLQRETESPERFPISVVILTKDEQDNIRDCLDSLDWADDVILVDSGSSDDTIAYAQEARPDLRVFENPFVDFGTQRNWALDSTAPQHEWVLFLDADERSTPAFAKAVQDAATSPGPHVGFYLSCRNYFLGKWIKRCTFYPSWQLRLLKLGEVRFRKEGHGQRETTDGNLGFIQEPYDHFGFNKGVSHWIERHNRYSTEELELVLRMREEPLRLRDLFSHSVARRRCLKRVAARFQAARPFLRFFYTYFWRLGFLDGRPGLLFCLLRVAHEIHISVKLAEMRFDEAQSESTPRETAAKKTGERVR